MLVTLWNEVLLRPLFNLLIFFYNILTYNNLGVAVIFMTLLIRLLLLPFSMLSEKGRQFYKDLAEKIREINKDYGSDYIKKKEVVRELLRHSHINPWSRAVVLGVQLLVLIVMYQVFISGINAKEKASLLYGFVTHPDFVNTGFLWFRLDQRDFLISALAGFALFLEITITNSLKREILSRKDQIFRLVFPLFTVLVLWILPSVKAVFILTSIIFSIILIIMVDIILESFKARFTAKKQGERPTVDLKDISIKRIK